MEGQPGLAAISTRETAWAPHLLLAVRWAPGANRCARQSTSVSRRPPADAEPDATTNAAPLALAAPCPGVALWWFGLDRSAGELARCRASLSAGERERAARFGTDFLRQRWIAGRGTLRRLLGEALGLPPERVPLRRGVRGRPEVDLPGAPDFNVSNTRGVALVGIGHGLAAGSRIGVDLERADRIVNADGLASKFLTERERAGIVALGPEERRRSFLRLWTCKEAMSKATGDALSAPFRRIDVDLAGLRLLSGPPPYEPASWSLHAADVPGAYLATVAVWPGRGES
uniref:Phosphopantetheinyl transferase n=1 Tax=bacterium enrichment culture TaxID=207831 RepID=A0A0R7N6J8_9BACT|nr:phosphopantetheinyl transferase [bacterium enrichment culture]